MPAPPLYVRDMKTLTTPLLVGLLASCTPAQPDIDYLRLQGEGLGTTWSATWRPGPGEAEVSADLVAVLQRVDAHMSTWRDDSELSVARRADGRSPVSEDTWQVVGASLDLAQATGGAFDPTVQPLMELWGFHGGGREGEPTPEEIEATLGRVGWQGVLRGRDGEGQAWLDLQGRALDLSATAKGYAVDELAFALSMAGAADFMVEVGGEVRVAGRGPSGQPWTLGIDAPVEGNAPGQQLAARVELGQGAVATSGNYRNVRRVGERLVAHTLDPRVGRPVQSDVLSATVLADDCMTADGWATALMVLGSEEGLRLVERTPGVEAWLLVGTEEGWAPRSSSGVSSRVTTLAAPIGSAAPAE